MSSVQTRSFAIFFSHFLLLFSIVQFFISVGLAQDSSTGCGLGTYVIPDNRTIVSATARMSLNLLSLNQYFGISSGTSGCGKYRYVKNSPLHQKSYFLANYQDILFALSFNQWSAPILNEFPCDLQSSKHSLPAENQIQVNSFLQQPMDKQAELFLLWKNQICAQKI